MATLADLGVSAGVNILSCIVFLMAFVFLRLQPINDRVYYPKWYLKQMRQDAKSTRRTLSGIVNLNWRVYIRFLSWTREALQMPEAELIQHAGLDSAVFLRVYALGLKVFVPLMIMGFGILVPINATGQNLNTQIDVDKLSLSNVPTGSQRLWAHVALSYVFTAWVCGTLYVEYKKVMMMRLQYLDSQDRQPEQYTVLVTNIPKDPDESPNLHVEHFFRVNHPDYYITHQMVCNANKLEKLVKEKEYLQNWLTFYENKQARHPELPQRVKSGFLGLWGRQVDAVQHYRNLVECKAIEIEAEHSRILKDPKAVLPVAFVSFKGRWGAAVAAQTQQTKNPTIWLTEWAPEPNDVYWPNLAIPFVELSIRRLSMLIALYFLVFFFMIPVAFVQTLANLDSLSKTFKFLRPVLALKFVSSFLQGYLPGLALKIFLLLLPWLLMLMSKIEGYTSLSSLERRAAHKYFIFLVITVFFGSIFTGSAYQQLHSILNESPSKIPNLLGEAVGSKAVFFVTYIMLDGWAGVAAEILRLKPLIIFHLKNTFLVKTEKDREEAMDPGSIGFNESLPQLELYFLFGLVFSLIQPMLLPFIIIFFAFAYVVYRHQIINVYNQEYESAGAFWPHVHTRVICCLIIQQICMMGLLATKRASQCTPILIFLVVFTIAFHIYCKNRFEPAFRRYPLEEAMARDTRERAMDPNFNIKRYLEGSYLHPSFQVMEDEESKLYEGEDCIDDPPLVPTKRYSRGNTPVPSVTSESAML